MKDEENPNIEYRQASIPQVAVFIMFITLLILGLLILVFYFISTVIDKGMNNLAIISLVAAIYVLISITLNIFVVSNVIRFKFDDHPTLFIVLTFVSLNIPCGIMMLVARHKEKEELEEEE